MNDLKELLDRRAARFEPAAKAFEHVLRRARRRNRTRRVTAGTLALVLFAGSATILWLAFTGQTELADPTPRPTAVEEPVPPAVEEPVMSIPLGGDPLHVAAGAGAVWASMEDEVVKLDPETGSVTGRFPLRGGGGLAVVGDRVCSPHLQENTINCVAADGSSPEEHPVEPLPFEVAPGEDAFLPFALVATEDAVWVDTARGALARLDPETFERTDLVRLDPAGPGWLAASSEAVWVINTLRGGGLWRVGTGDLLVRSIPAPLIDHVAAGPGGVWATSAFGSALRFDESNGTITDSVELGAAGPLVVTEAHAFVAHRDGSLSQVDLSGPAVSTQVPIGFRGAVSITATRDALWIAAHDDGAVWRVALCAGSLCEDATPEPSVEPSPTSSATPDVPPGTVALEPGPAEPPVAFVAGRTLYLPGREPIRLAAEAQAPLMGWLSPVAVPTPDGRSIFYNSWIDLGGGAGRPVLRVLDVETGVDSAVQEGAFSVALHPDGRIATFSKSEPDYVPSPDERYVGHIVVRDGLSGEPVQWTVDEDRYIVVGWAGDTLLAYRQGCCEILDIVALDGPGQVRVLGRGGNVVAISPDGGRGFMVGGVDGSDFGGLGRVVDVATGEVLAQIDLSTTEDPVTGRSVAPPTYGGSWDGDRIVATSNGLVVMRVSGESIVVERDYRIPDVRFGAYEPQWERGHVVAWAVLPGSGRPTAYLDCDLEQERCFVGPPSAESMYRAYNPSRPVAHMMPSPSPDPDSTELPPFSTFPCPVGGHPSLPTGIGCVSEATADLDGDGSVDRLLTYALVHPNGIPETWHGRVDLASGDASSLSFPEELVQSPVRPEAAVDLDGDGDQEILTRIWQGASEMGVSVVMLDEAGSLILARMASGSVLEIAMSGSVGHGSGGTCRDLDSDGTRELVLRNISYDDTSEAYEWRETTYRWEGPTLLQVRVDRGTIRRDDPKRYRYWTFSCGEFQVTA